MKQDKELRNQLVSLLTVRQAHVDFEDAVANLPAEHINTKAAHCTYSFWHLVEHMRICQRDLLEYITSEHYVWPNFPDDLWPEQGTTTTLEGWQHSLGKFISDRQHLVNIIQDPKTDLFAPLPNSGKHQHNILREINIIASHNAYHTGEIVILQKTLGFWPVKNFFG
jgi:DinB superfamily